MKSILKRNQIIISVIAVMLIAAGYMNYTANTNETLQAAALVDTEQYAELGDATLVSANIATDEQNNQSSNNAQQGNIQTESNLASSIITETSSKTEDANTTENTKKQVETKDQYFTESRLEREKMYSQMLETYQNILASSQISDTQKEISQNEIIKINEIKNAIMITENLIKNKGFEDAIIFVNGESISIIIKAEELSQEQIAQIQNIVSRELKGEIDNIHISNK